MQIVELELNHLNFYCPATGHPILSEDGDGTAGAKSLKGLWIDEVFSEPEFKDAAFEKAWKAYYEEHFDEEEDNEYEIQEEFLKTYPEANWVTYKITTSGIACGPISSTAWLVIDMDTEVKQG
jgi:hypothetical protein